MVDTRVGSAYLLLPLELNTHPRPRESSLTVLVFAQAEAVCSMSAVFPLRSCRLMLAPPFTSTSTHSLKIF